MCLWRRDPKSAAALCAFPASSSCVFVTINCWILNRRVEEKLVAQLPQSSGLTRTEKRAWTPAALAPGVSECVWQRPLSGSGSDSRCLSDNTLVVTGLLEARRAFKYRFPENCFNLVLMAADRVMLESRSPMWFGDIMKLLHLHWWA